MTNLKRIIKKHKISQAEVARQLNITRMSVNGAVKNGLKNTTTAKKYAAALGCSWQELIDED